MTSSIVPTPFKGGGSDVLKISELGGVRKFSVERGKFSKKGEVLLERRVNTSAKFFRFYSRIRGRKRK